MSTAHAHLMLMADAAPSEHAGTHAVTAMAMAGAAPPEAKAGIGDLITKATAANIPWAKILGALAIAAMGGFTPAAIAAALASLFGPAPAPPTP